MTDFHSVFVGTRARTSFALLLGVFFFFSSAQIQAQSKPDILAKSALLVDAGTGEVLFAKNPDQPHPPASTVKLLTALLVWERTGLAGSIRVSREDTQVEPSHIPLRIGETVAIRDMTHALLIGSDNDSAMVLARAAGGSLGSFVTQMNSRARALGCRRSVFKNPHGLPAAGQVTTASDLMKIFQKVLSVPELRKICTTKSYRLNTQVGAQNVRNHNKLLGTYTGMSAAKTGWTQASRHTYAASAVRNGRELHLILLNSSNKWVDARELFDYGFARPSRVAPPRDVLLAQKPAPNSSSPSAPANSKPVIETQAPMPARLRLDTSAPASTPSSSMISHQVRKGETLFSIGRIYKVDVPTLLRHNHLSDPDQIHPGQVLFIPRSPAT
ncbi:MAG: LysM peptidoglycan-binding domain-containing protein [Blastochloris sp.]|nr:LysM peptidoglycan-binding domain-containing protein [Blastochloris sp.]